MNEQLHGMPPQGELAELAQSAPGLLSPHLGKTDRKARRKTFRAVCARQTHERKQKESAAEDLFSALQALLHDSERMFTGYSAMMRQNGHKMPLGVVPQSFVTAAAALKKAREK